MSTNHTNTTRTTPAAGAVVPGTAPATSEAVARLAYRGRCLATADELRDAVGPALAPGAALHRRRYASMTVLALHTGAWPAEIVHVHRADLHLPDAGAGAWHVTSPSADGKALAPARRTIPLPAPIVQMLRDWTDLAGDGPGQLFVAGVRPVALGAGWQLFLRHACRAGGLPDTTPHDLRTIAITTMLGEGFVADAVAFLRIRHNR